MNQDIREHQNNQRLNESLAFNLELLSYRLEKLKTINTMKKINQFEFLTYFDSALVQVRSMLLENGNKNFTLQNYYKKNNSESISMAIDEYLNQPFDCQDEEIKQSNLKQQFDSQNNEENIKFKSLRDNLKFVVDKFICHHDKTSILEIGSANYMMATFANKHHKRYLVNIIEDIINITKK
ncbi:hypothetical protein CVO_06000 [Sulfurimonas sp. CVO]|uniref:hypothetical protein n=1 Tax=Sulfurimonas sp. CVO TaxID=2283483 RepID=UPI00132ED98D|nr:hypothetical protein [Sulfurimonas sp. CVO]QHG91413.1 hypothetical protein CVO_06000 [Sulfurimonas sp. CVO]